jgi:hypothetical protein
MMPTLITRVLVLASCLVAARAEADAVPFYGVDLGEAENYVILSKTGISTVRAPVTLSNMPF